jgi:hypothetical protein
VATPVQQLDKKNAPPQRHEVLKPDFQVQPQPRTRGGQSGARQAFRQGAAGAAQQQDPQARRNVGSQRQAQQQAVNQGGNRQGASAGQSQGQGASRGRSQAASNKQSQDAPRKQSSGESKEKDKD